MQLFLPNIEQPNIIFLDIEYDQGALVQLALLKLSLRCDANLPHIFELIQSVNLYVKQGQSLTGFFQNYTNITNDFLCDNGIDLSVARTLVREIVPDDSLIISHGIHCDLDILKRNGIDWTSMPHFCTYEQAKKILGRNTGVSLKDIAALDGFYAFDEHNAYADVWATLHAFCYLNKQQNKENN